MKEGAEKVELKIQAKVESLKNANEGDKGMRKCSFRLAILFFLPRLDKTNGFTCLICCFEFIHLFRFSKCCVKKTQLQFYLSCNMGISICFFFSRKHTIIHYLCFTINELVFSRCSSIFGMHSCMMDMQRMMGMRHKRMNDRVVHCSTTKSMQEPSMRVPNMRN